MIQPSVSLIFFISILFSSLIAMGQTIQPKQEAEIIIDNLTPGKANPGDRIRYKVTIENAGGAAGEDVQLNINPDPRTTFLPGSFLSSPLALDDAFPVTGNVGIDIGPINGLISNDFDDHPGMLTVSSGTFATSEGGIIIINANGSFSYTPPAGFTGMDTYVYTLNDGTPVDGGPTTDNATVTFTISNAIWFIDNSSAAASSAGTLDAPFKTLADFNASSGPLAGHLIFIRHTGTNYPGGIVLKNDQVLFGSGHTGGDNLVNVLPFALAPSSKILPAINGTRPLILNAGGDGVALASGNTLRGFNIGACSDFGMENIGTGSVGNLIISEVDINNTSGGGFRAGNGSGASMNVVFTTITSSGGTNGVLLNNCAGTFTVNGGTITNPTGTAVQISGGSVVYNSSGVINKTNAGRAVDIDNHNSGNATFSGNITSNGTGIRVANCGGGTKTFSGSSKDLNTGANTALTLSSNTGATINFSGGGLVIATTSGTGFNATGGGTITVQGIGNTINSVSASALIVTSTTIGAGNLTFQSITSGNNTPATNPASGIVLNTTGTAGRLTVTGTGSAGSGGTIRNCTASGISLTNTSNPSFSFMNILNNLDNGILGSLVTGINLTNCTVTNNGDANLEHGIFLTNLLGSSTITNCTVTNNSTSNFRLSNTSGTLTSLAVSGSTFDDHNNSGNFGENGFHVTTSQNALITAVTVDNCNFRNNKIVGLWVVASNTSTITSFIVTGSTFSDTGTGNSQEIGADFTKEHTSNLTFKFLNNTLMDHNAQPINSFTAAGEGTGGVLIGTIEGNTIGNASEFASGSRIGDGIRVSINGAANAIFRIHNNTIRQVPNGRGMAVVSRNGTGGLDLTLTNNFVNNDYVETMSNQGFSLASILIQSNCVATCNTLRADVRGNTVPPTPPNGDVLFFQLALAQTGGSTFQLVDNPPASPNATTELTENHTNPAHNNIGNAGASPGIALIAGPINVPPN